jgi:hypothetical protein
MLSRRPAASAGLRADVPSETNVTRKCINLGLGPPISCPTQAIQPMTLATLKAHRTGVEAPRCVSLAPNNNDRGHA